MTRQTPKKLNPFFPRLLTNAQEGGVPHIYLLTENFVCPSSDLQALLELRAQAGVRYKMLGCGGGSPPLRQGQILGLPFKGLLMILLTTFWAHRSPIFINSFQTPHFGLSANFLQDSSLNWSCLLRQPGDSALAFRHPSPTPPRKSKNARRSPRSERRGCK